MAKRGEKKPLVLVVEDEWMVAATIEQSLTDNGYNVLGPVASLHAALALIEESRPDMALLDFRLARTTSEPLVQPLQNLGVQICVITGFGRLQLPDVYAACSVLEKPYSARDLLAVLSTMLGIDH